MSYMWPTGHSSLADWRINDPQSFESVVAKGLRAKQDFRDTVIDHESECTCVIIQKPWPCAHCIAHPKPGDDDTELLFMYELLGPALRKTIDEVVSGD